MRFWDSSAIVAILIEEPRRADALRFLEEDQSIVVWWATTVECVSAISRRERDGSLTSEAVRSALGKLATLREEWNEIVPSAPMRATAERLLRVHPLRAGDALQLAAALTLAEREPSSLTFLSLDDRLNDAAAREGLRIV